MPAKKRSSEKERLYTWTEVYLVGLILFFVLDFIPSLYRHSPRQQFSGSVESVAHDIK